MTQLYNYINIGGFAPVPRFYSRQWQYNTDVLYLN